MLNEEDAERLRRATEIFERDRQLRLKLARPDIPYVICTMPRTGSSLLCQLLTSTGVAGRPGEYFSDGYLRYWSRMRGGPGFLDYLMWLVELFKTPNGVFGVKLLSNQFESFHVRYNGYPDPTLRAHRAALTEWLPNVKYVWLRREDVLQQAISHTRAVQTNTWSSNDRPENDPFRSPRTPENLRYDREMIDYFLDRVVSGNEIWDRYFETNKIEPFELTYEALVKDQSGAVRAVTDHVGVDLPDDFSAITTFTKQADATTNAWVERYMLESRSTFSLKQEDE